MKSNPLTKHAVVRLAQRGISLSDADLVVLVGTEVADGYLITKRDVQECERQVRKELDRLRRLAGKLLIVRDGLFITAFHSTQRQQRRLLR